MAKAGDMKINLRNVGKRFNREWIFRHLDHQFISGVSYAITGPNGSGKSTLLQIIGGATTLSEGDISYDNIGAVATENVYKNVSIAAPYLELIEEMTVTEFLSFHGSMKPFIPSLRGTKQSQIEQIIEIIGLQASANKEIRFYSSGMKQRVKLAQAIFSDVSLILLDEPCTNLDEEGISLYKRLINDYCKDRLILVSSNDKNEYDFCREVLDIRTVKQA
jgi:ABC-type multidrug transport system ATPase subunit